MESSSGQSMPYLAAGPEVIMQKFLNICACICLTLSSLSCLSLHKPSFTASELIEL